jgi:hypothetical protein
MGGSAGAPEEEPPPRVKERFVTIELPRVGTRPLTPNEDGGVDWGELTELSDVETCVIERRDLYAVFEPYEPLEKAICVTTEAGELPALRVPGFSDLTITVSRDGYLPAALTHRVEGSDVLTPNELLDTALLLFQEDRVGLFERSLDGSGAVPVRDRAFLMLESVVYSRAFAIAPGPLALGGGTTAFQLGKGLHSKLQGLERETSGTVSYDQTPEFLQLPGDLYRVDVSLPGAECEPFAQPLRTTYWGLSTGEIERFELRTLSGHVTSLLVMCVCAPPSPTAVLVEPASCTYEEPDE